MVGFQIGFWDYAAAIYTHGETGAWAALRKISLRAHSWLNWIYPFNF
jgi:hypothetical protein